MESTGGYDPVVTVNGHSYAGWKSSNTNFALLVSTDFTKPFHEPIAYGKYLAKLANILSGGVLVQRFGDLLDGHRSTPERISRGLVEPTLKSAVPGDLSFALELLTLVDFVYPGIDCMGRRLRVALLTALLLGLALGQLLLGRGLGSFLGHCLLLGRFLLRG